MPGPLSVKFKKLLDFELLKTAPVLSNVRTEVAFPLSSVPYKASGHLCVSEIRVKIKSGG